MNLLFSDCRLLIEKIWGPDRELVLDSNQTVTEDTDTVFLSERKIQKLNPYNYGRIFKALEAIICFVTSCFKSLPSISDRHLSLSDLKDKKEGDVYLKKWVLRGAGCFKFEDHIFVLITKKERRQKEQELDEQEQLKREQSRRELDERRGVLNRVKSDLIVAKNKFSFHDKPLLG